MKNHFAALSQEEQTEGRANRMFAHVDRFGDHRLADFASTLRPLKYRRSQQLIGILGDLLQRIVQSIPEANLPEWIQAIGVYVMSVNKNIDAQQYKQTLKSILPVQFEPGSLADRLLICGNYRSGFEMTEQGANENFSSTIP